MVYDGFLQAENALLEMTVDEFLSIGLRILDNNPYQRRRVSGSSSIYSLLSRDLRKCCSIPTIVLAFVDESNPINLSTMDEEAINRVMRSRDLIILDGLQRTYTMRDVAMDLFFPDGEKERFRNHIVRVEVYCGLSKTGILYRMLTLNTGQTPMSKRHEIEILYSSYLENSIDGITFNRQVEPVAQRGIDVYNFDDAIEGFNSFLDADESFMDRYDLLAVVQRLDKVTNDDFSKDLFVQYITLYNKFVHKIDERTNHWAFSQDQASRLMSVYGKDIPSFFNKSQTMSAFGAALGRLLGEGEQNGFGDYDQQLNGLTMGGESDDVMLKFLITLQAVREGAKKIGMAQRSYLRFFFEALLDSRSESYLNCDKSIVLAKKTYYGETL